jgi:hypothetical protein
MKFGQNWFDGNDDVNDKCPFHVNMVIRPVSKATNIQCLGIPEITQYKREPAVES